MTPAEDTPHNPPFQVMFTKCYQSLVLVAGRETTTTTTTRALRKNNMYVVNSAVVMVVQPTT